MLAAWAELGLGIHRYGAVLVLDDDLALRPRDIVELFDLRQRLDLAIVGPTFDPRGRVSFRQNRTEWRTAIRFSTFVEENAPLFRRDVLERFLDQFDRSLAGFGIDMWYCGPTVIGPGDRLAIADTVSVVNPHSRAGIEGREIDQLFSQSERERRWNVARSAHGLVRVTPDTLGSFPRPTLERSLALGELGVALLGRELGPHREFPRLGRRYLDRARRSLLRRRGPDRAPGASDHSAPAAEAPAEQASNTRHPATPLRDVPHVVHLTTRDRADLRPLFRTNLRLLEEHLPGWEIRIHDDSDIDAFVRSSDAAFHEYVFERLPLRIMRVDAVRYLWMREVGGVYLDFDVELTTPWEPQPGATFIEREWTWPTAKDIRLSVHNCVLASSPAHPVWSVLLTDIAHRAEVWRSWRWRAARLDDVFEFTGPNAISRSLSSISPHGGLTGVHILPASLIHQPGMSTGDGKDALFVHHTSASWRSDV
jgi:hypothetical protein